MVDEAKVFFEHTQATAGGIYNLWGQVPVKSDGPVVHYYNLTDMGVTHSGKTGVNYWFRDFIAPTLGDQAPLIQQLQFNGQIDNAESPATNAPSARAAWYSRPTTPEPIASTGRSRSCKVTSRSFPARPRRLDHPARSQPRGKADGMTLAGVTTASSTGQWSLTTRHPLRNGQYRTLVTAFSRALTTRPGLAIVPTQPLGRLVVDAPSGS